jgi:hypothetical protein
VLDGDRVPVAAVVAGSGHLTGVHGLVRGALGRRQVDAGVQLAEADAVRRGELVFLEREQPGVGLGLLLGDLGAGVPVLTAGGAFAVGALGEGVTGGRGLFEVLQDRGVDVLGVREL